MTRFSRVDDPSVAIFIFIFPPWGLSDVSIGKKREDYGTMRAIILLRQMLASLGDSFSFNHLNGNNIELFQALLLTRCVDPAVGINHIIKVRSIFDYNEHHFCQMSSAGFPRIHRPP